MEWCRLQEAPHLPDAASVEALLLVAIGFRQAVDALKHPLLHPVYLVALTELDGETGQDYNLEVEEEKEDRKRGVVSLFGL